MVNRLTVITMVTVAESGPINCSAITQNRSRFFRCENNSEIVSVLVSKFNELFYHTFNFLTTYVVNARLC